MCFSNLPVEFDDVGDPYLADEADDIEHVADCGCGTDVAIDESDPETVFEAVLSSVPESVREDISGRSDDRSGEPASDDTAPEKYRSDPAGGD